MLCLGNQYSLLVLENVLHLAMADCMVVIGHSCDSRFKVPLQCLKSVRPHRRTEAYHYGWNKRSRVWSPPRVSKKTETLKPAGNIWNDAEISEPFKDRSFPRWFQVAFQLNWTRAYYWRWTKAEEISFSLTKLLSSDLLDRKMAEPLKKVVKRLKDSLSGEGKSNKDQLQGSCCFSRLTR